MGQLASLYGEGWETLAVNCASIVFLGSSDPDTLQFIAGTMTGSETQQEVNLMARIKKGGEPMLTDELARMPVDGCIIRMAFFKPVQDQKYKAEDHPHYPQAADADKKNIFAYEELDVFRIPDA